jgi:hypothetical protein
MLYSNLDRQGTDIAVDTDLVYFDVNNRRIGINTATPGYALDSTGNARIANLYILGNTITSNTGKIGFNTISNVVIAGGSNKDVIYTDGNGNLAFANIAYLAGGLLGNNIALGTNTRGNLTTPALTLTTTTTVTDSVALINDVLGNIVTNLVTGTATVTGNLTAANLAVANFISGKIKTGTVTIPTSANIIYVATNGNDTTNDGTINSPFASISSAVNYITTNNLQSGMPSIHVAPGTYRENNPVTLPNNTSLIGDTIRSVAIIPQNPNSDIFYVSGGSYVWGLTVKNYNANAFAYSPAMINMNFYVSPYIQNITSSATSANACAVMVDGNFVGPLSTKGMIVGFYTMINQGGYGVRLKNSAYSQLVNIYTIGANVGVWSDSGSFCTLNGSDSSVGNIGLMATGKGPLLTYGNTSGYSTNGVFTITNMPKQPNVNQVMTIAGDPNYYSIDTITPIDSITYRVTVPETYVANLAPGANVTFYQRSGVVASAHTFEYVGAGTNLATALPQYGGIPNANLNVITSGGGRVTYTATDEKGNFWIGSNLTVNQGTGTIAGDAFNRSLFALMTPYILALDTAVI